MYAPAPNGILDDNGRLLPEVRAARRRGVWFDVGNGTTGHITWEQAEQAIQQGFIPHTISTDWTPQGARNQLGHNACACGPTNCRSIMCKAAEVFLRVCRATLPIVMLLRATSPAPRPGRRGLR